MLLSLRVQENIHEICVWLACGAQSNQTIDGEYVRYMYFNVSLTFSRQAHRHTYKQQPILYDRW